MKTIELETITRNFLAAALWADAPENTRPRVTRQAIAAARTFCEAFINENLELFNAAMQADGYGSHPDAGTTAAAFGLDLYFTQAGHGVGFWDSAELAFTPAGGADTLGNLLTKQCGHGTRFFTEIEFYRGWAYLYWPGAKTSIKAAA